MGFSFKSKSGSSTGGGVGDEELDRNVEEEIARNLWAHHRMLPPESKGKKLWNKFIVVLVLYTCISVPLVLCFNLDYGAPNNIPQVVVDYLIDVCFVVDMALTFRTTFFDADNELVLDKKLIARMYLRTTFGWDLAGTLPLELFGLAIPGYGWLIMHFRLLRLIRVYKVFKQIDVHNNVLRVSQMLISFMFFAHCVGSIWWALGVSYFNVEPQGNPPGTTWVVRAKVRGARAQAAAARIARPPRLPPAAPARRRPHAPRAPHPPRFAPTRSGTTRRCGRGRRGSSSTASTGRAASRSTWGRSTCRRSTGRSPR